MKLTERELSALDCTAGTTYSQWFSGTRWREWAAAPVQRARAPEWCGRAAGRTANAMPKIPPRVRAEKARRLHRFLGQKNLRENLLSRNSSESQKAKRSRKLRLPDTIRETMARSA